MKTQRDQKIVDLAQLLLDLDIGALTGLKTSDGTFFAWVTVEVDENGVRAWMIDHRANRLVPSCKTSFPFSKRLRWTRKRQRDDILRQMSALDPRSLLFLRFVRGLTLSAEQEGTKYWSKSVYRRRAKDDQCVELHTTTHGPLNSRSPYAQNPQTSDNISLFHVIEQPTLESGPTNRLIMAFPVSQYGVGQWTKDEDSFSFTFKKPSPFKFLVHADRWGALDPTNPQYKIHQAHEMTDFHTRAMAKGFKKLSEIPSLRYTWMQYLPSTDCLRTFDTSQRYGLSTLTTTLPRWLSLLPILETENDADRNQLHAITDLRLNMEKELDPTAEDLVPDVANAPLTFSVSVDPPPGPPSPRRTRRQSNNHPTTADTTPTSSLVSAPISSKYRRRDLETLLSDYTLNLFPQTTIISHLQFLITESKSASWYAKFFFLRPQHEDFHSRVARFLLLTYNKKVECPGFQSDHHDGWRELINSICFIPLASGKLQSPKENKHAGLHAPVNKKGKWLAVPATDLTQLPIEVVHPGAWKNEDCRKLIETARYVVR